MNLCAAILALDATDRVAFRKSDLRHLLGGGTAAEKTIDKLIRGGILVRAVRGVYVSALAARRSDTTLHEIARCARRGEFIYESFESAADKRGMISQCVMALTVATSGYSNTFTTPFGTIAFTHVEGAGPAVANTRDLDPQGPHRLLLASRDKVLTDMVVAGKPLHLIEEEEAAYGRA